MQPLPAGTHIAYVDTNPVLAQYGLSEVILDPQWADQPETVKAAVIELGTDFDIATCDVCDKTIGGYLGYDRDRDRETFEFTEAILVVAADGSTARYCFEDAVEQGYLTEDDEQ